MKAKNLLDELATLLHWGCCLLNMIGALRKIDGLENMKSLLCGVGSMSK